MIHDLRHQLRDRTHSMTGDELAALCVDLSAAQVLALGLGRKLADLCQGYDLPGLDNARIDVEDGIEHDTLRPLLALARQERDRVCAEEAARLDGRPARAA